MAARNGSQLPDPATTLTATAKGLVEEFGRALEAAAGRPVKCGAPDVASLPADEVEARLVGTAAAFCMELGGALYGRAALILPGPVASGLAGLLAGEAGPDLTARTRRDPSDQDIESLAEPFAGALVGVAEKLAAYVGEVPGLGLGDAVIVRAGAADEFLKTVGSGPYPAASFQIDVEDLAGGQAMILFPRSFKATAPGDGAMSVHDGDTHLAGLGAPRSPFAELHPNIRRILRLKLQVSVVVAEKGMDCESVLKLNPGTIIEFDKSADDVLDLVVNGHKIGSGEVVIISERFGIQLRHIEGVEQRIRKMGSAG